MASTLLGHIGWELTRDSDGYRTYSVKWKCRVDDPKDGPHVIFNTPQLPQIGSLWGAGPAFAGYISGAEPDIYAQCNPDMRISPQVTPDKDVLWIVEQSFSTRPFCENYFGGDHGGDPILLPDEISGSFVKYTQEVDRSWVSPPGAWYPILSTSHEPLRGAMVEFDNNRPTVTIKRNLLNLPLADLAQMMDTVNGVAMWGLPPRCIKLSQASWQRLPYFFCEWYYSIEYTFDVNFNTFDKWALNEGHKQQNPELTNPDQDDPEHYSVAKDDHGENTKKALDINGNPIRDWKDAIYKHVVWYLESDFQGAPLLIPNIP